LVKYGTGRSVEISVPFADAHKPEGFASTFLGSADLFRLTWSCKNLDGRPVQCGACAGCLARRVAAELAGLEDLTAYESPEPMWTLEDKFRRPLAEYSDELWAELYVTNPMPSPK
jgi:hypothetical protein